jgi:hypothetical protein
MKKRFAILAGFVILALADCLFSYAMPVDYTYQHMSVVWHLYFCGMIVFVHDKPAITRILIGISCGLAADLLMHDSFAFCTFLYPFFAWLAGVFPGRMRGNEFAFAWYMASVFLLDFIPYAWMKLTGMTTLGLIKWLEHIELLTLLTNGLAIILIMYADMVMVRFFLIQDNMKRKKALKARRAKALRAVHARSQ